VPRARPADAWGGWRDRFVGAVPRARPADAWGGWRDREDNGVA